MTFYTDFKDFHKSINLFRSNNVSRHNVDQPEYIQYALNAVIQDNEDTGKSNNENQLLKRADKVLDIDIYSDVMLKKIDNDNNSLSDKIIYNNVSYEIVSCVKYDYFGTLYYKSLAQYHKEPEDVLLSLSVPSPTPLPDTPIESLLPVFVQNEQATGTKNGINLVFSTVNDFLYSFLQVTLNGQRLTKDVEYTQLSDNEITLEATLAPQNNESLIFDYWLKI